jgi:hypothetical protein
MDWTTSDTKIATWLAMCGVWPESLRLSPEERRKKDMGGHAHYEMVYERRPSDRVLAAFHDPENVMHDVLNAYHWIRRQLHEAQTTDLDRPPFRRP